MGYSVGSSRSSFYFKKFKIWTFSDEIIYDSNIPEETLSRLLSSLSLSTKKVCNPRRISRLFHTITLLR